MDDNTTKKKRRKARKNPLLRVPSAVKAALTRDSCAAITEPPDVPPEPAAILPTPPPEPVKMGRPPIVIDWNAFDSLVQMHCTEEEVAYFFKCDISTVYEKCKEKHGVTFPEYFKANAVGGRMSLRRRLWQNALGDRDTKPHAATAIFLSKQKDHHGGLGFTDKTKLELPLVPGAEEDGSGDYEWKMGIVRRLESRKSKEKPGGD